MVYTEWYEIRDARTDKVLGAYEALDAVEAVRAHRSYLGLPSSETSLLNMFRSQVYVRRMSREEV